MYAVWKYDLFPYILTGKMIGEIDDDGLVKVEGYQTYSRFEPIKIISDNNGVKLKEKISELRDRERAKKEELKKQGKKEIEEIIGTF